MEKVYAAARALAVILAIVAAFVEVPQAGVALLVLGGLAAVGNPAEHNIRVYLVTIVLALSAQSLSVLPAVGAPLAAIFGNLGLAFVGASIVAITLGLVGRLKSDWVK